MHNELPPLYDLRHKEALDALCAVIEGLRPPLVNDGEAGRTVAEIIEGVRRRGDEAVVEYMRRWTDPEFHARRIRVTEDDLARAYEQTPGELRDALARSIDHVRAYQRHLLPVAPEAIEVGGAALGLRFVPMASAG